MKQMGPDRWRKLKDWFSEALEMEPLQREAFLAEISAGDPVLGDELRKLLVDHQGAERYFGGVRPGPPQSNVVLRNFRPGEIVCGRFRVVSLIGSGGMGEVYKAVDEILGVAVAVKTIRSSMLTDERLVGRLQKEVLLAREITHPNVCRVHDLFHHRVLASPDEPEHGIPFISMEFLAGETLAERLRREGVLHLDVAFHIIVQIAEGLAAAHHAGVVHRDLKPGNIMLVPAGTQRERTVITDFGLARRDLAIDGSSTISLAGTPGYMAPEQLEGMTATFRSDIYSFGVIAFQILVGHVQQERESGRLASTIPESASDPLAGTLKKVILRCLQRSPDMRFTSAEQVVNELLPDRMAKDERAPQLTHWRFIVPSVAILIICVALFLVILRFSSWMPKIARGSRVLLTEIRVPEANLDGLTTVLRSQLAQSPQFVLIDDTRLGEILKRMGKTAGEPLDGQAAREVALRDGAPLVIYGSASVLGQEYVLALKIEQVSGTPLFARRVWKSEFPANDKSQLFDAIHRAATWIRTTVGEATQDLAEQDRRPEDTTTGSWQALQLFERARRASGQGNNEAAVLVLREAIQIDPEFAMAYAKMGDLLIALKRYQEGYVAWKQALRLTEKKQLTSREQLLITGQYYEDTGDYPAAERTYRTFLVHYPDDYDGGFFLASVLDETGRSDEAASRFAELWRRWPREYTAAVHLASIYIKQKKLPQAMGIAVRLGAFGQPDWARWLNALMLFTQQRTDKALETAEPLQSSPSKYWRSRAYLIRASWLAELDRCQEGIAELQEGIAYDSAQGLSQEEAHKYYLLAQLHVRTGARTAANSDCAAACAIDNTPRQAAHIGIVFAQTGSLIEARRILASLRSYDDIPRLVALRHQLAAEIDLAEHSPARALREMRAAAATSPPQEWREEMARTLEADGLRDQAVQVYKEILDEPALFWPGPQTNVPGLQLQCRRKYLELTTDRQ
jgi:serine/threonine protein kinase/thioredoxin-like negative regulator of GroEL